MTASAIGRLDSVCAEGMAHHQSGRIDEARRLYRKVLERNPRHLRALHLLAMIHLDTGKAGDALTLVARALQVAPNDAEIHWLRGASLAALGRHAEALASYEAAIAAKPMSATAHYNRAVALAALCRDDDALASYDEALALQPDFPQAHANRTAALEKLGRMEEALASYDRALSLDPAASELRTARGWLLFRLKRFRDALADFEALAATNESATAHHGQGVALLELARAQVSAEGRHGLRLSRLESVRFQKALASLDKAAALAPADAALLCARSAALLELGLLDEALEAADLAITQDPGAANAHRGAVLAGLGRLSEAEASLHAALQLMPGSADAHHNLGAVLYDQGRADEALASFDRAIALEPNRASSHFSSSTALLKLDRFEEGWALYEWRHKMLGNDPRHGQPAWLGDAPLEGRTILLRSEQGLGDVLQFCRYARELHAAGAEVVLDAPPALAELLRGVPGVGQVIMEGDAVDGFDLHCPLMSLPLALTRMGVGLFDPSPYLRADPGKAALWKARLCEGDHLRVGLVWNGGFRAERRELWQARRNLPFQVMAGLNLPGVEFFSLQKGEPAESELKRERPLYWPSDNLHIVIDEIENFSDTAALVANLDLVISVDTSTAHLAGGMGKPVWILNRFDNCWRWGNGRQDTPWYPSARLFRQPTPGDWRTVIAQVRQELESLTAGSRERVAPAC